MSVLFYVKLGDNQIAQLHVNFRSKIEGMIPKAKTILTGASVKKIVSPRN
jgi:hypothetical protein